MSKCGLGVRDFRLVNLTVLAKWMRCIISCASGLWKDVFLSCYVTSIAYSLRSGRDSGFRRSSSWWKSVSLIDSKYENLSNWFVGGITRKIDLGFLTYFWIDP